MKKKKESSAGKGTLAEMNSDKEHKAKEKKTNVDKSKGIVGTMNDN